MIEVLKQALEALETEVSIDWTNNDEFNASAEKMHDAITSLRQAIAELEREKEIHDRHCNQGEWKGVCKYSDSNCPTIAELESQEPLCTAAMFDDWFLAKSGLDPKTPLYTHPPQRTWVGLTESDVSDVCANNHPLDGVFTFARAIEAKLKEKNT